jgi:hypothetical protein
MNISELNDMTIYQEKLEARCEAARKWAPCLGSACDRERRGEPICDGCKDTNEKYARDSITNSVKEAIKILEHYGFTVEEK